MDLKENLISLCKLEKVSGDETNCAKILKNLLKPYSENVLITNNNSVIAKIQHKNNLPEIILTAHLDEIGFMVSEITKEGYLKLKNCGGISTNIANFQKVTVLGKEKLTGFTFFDDKTKTLLADVGLTKEKIENLVQLGDRVAFEFNPIFLNDQKFCSKSLDDCAGIVTILLAIEKLNKLKLNCKLTTIFSSQEEISGNGVKVSSYFCNAEIAVCVDVSFAKHLYCEDENFAEMMKGPLIGISPILDSNLSEHLKIIAKKNKIPYQLEIMNGLTSTDADKIVKTKKGIKTCLLSIPIRYMHSPIEQVAFKDIENTAKLIAEFIKSI